MPRSYLEDSAGNLESIQQPVSIEARYTRQQLRHLSCTINSSGIKGLLLSLVAVTSTKCSLPSLPMHNSILLCLEKFTAIRV